MSTVTVPALKPLTYQGRSYVRGELVEMVAIDAAVRSRRGEVAIDGSVIEQEHPRGRAARRRYRRRDMTAEATTE